MLGKNLTNRLPRLPLYSPWLIIIGFSILGFIGIINHAMWRDELNPWLIVKYSESFKDLITNIRYEGHPVLWYFSLAILKNIVDHSLIMQIFHWSIMVIAVAIFCLYSPFTQLQKFLFTFGYLIFYEYLLISRNYAFSVLFIFAFCAIFSSRKITYLYLACLLGLLANSSAYALLVALSLTLTLLAEFCFDSSHRQLYFNRSRKYDLFLSIVIVIFLFLLSIYIIKPPGDSYLHGGLEDGWVFQLDIRRFLISISRLLGSYFLVLPKRQFLDLSIFAFLTAFVFIFISIKLAKKPFALCLYFIGNLIILTFTYLRFAGHTRHYGHLYLLLIASLWIGSYYQESNFLINKLHLKTKLLSWVDKWYAVIFMLILYVNLIGGLSSFSRDLFIPYSAAKETVSYIKQSNLEREFIVGSRDANMAAIAGYLNRQLYYPEIRKLGSFTLFKQGRTSVEQPEVLAQISSILNNQTDTKRILLILHKKLNVTDKNLQITPIKSFERAWVDSERFYLYWVQKL